MKNFNKMRRALLTLCCALLLVAISVGATVAYLTDRDSVKNTFTVGKVGINLDETDVNEYGVKDSDARVKANEYKLVPGHTYVKDPTVTIAADSEVSYIRMLVTVNERTDLAVAFDRDRYPERWATIEGEDILLIQYFVEGWDKDVWLFETASVDEANDSVTYEFRYFEPVGTVDAEEKKLAPLFETIVLPDTMVNNDVNILSDLEDAEDDAALTVDVVAQAIQKDTFADDDAAWAAFQ